MFSSLLIANRGEIACRIIRTCRRLGIRSVAVYSDADRHARHVREADATVHIGPAEAAGSYLNPQALIAAAKASGAQAVHPGYGFLSEKTVLAQRCAQEGLVWVGPRADVIRLMGSKIESKIIAQRAGVPTVPGYHGESQDAPTLLARADEIGWPVLIKASAGGGGKGMRRINQASDFIPMLDEARREAQRAFGDDRILVEKLIANPRHLEVQVLGDQHGHLIHLHERECSVQRHYQKVIEEAPAAFLSDQVREALHRRALQLGHEIQYDSVGTVEFVLDEGTDEPYFLEMNTRLQVEHPVTEWITGLDLVELQLRVAAGEALPLTQDDIAVCGHAIEARVNCEDAAHGYRPQVGHVTRVHEPTMEGVRIDCGIHQGSDITPHYDSMMAKVIGHGPHREAAARHLLAGLREFQIEGVGTNQCFLQDIIEHPYFHGQALTTHFLSRVFPQGWSMPREWQEDALAAALYQGLSQAQALAQAAGDPWGASHGFRLVGRHRHAPTAWRVEGWSEAPIDVSLGRHGTHWQLSYEGGVPVSVQLSGSGGSHSQATDLWVTVTRPHDTVHSGGARKFQVITETPQRPSPRSVTVCADGQRWTLQIQSRLEAMAAAASGQERAQGEIRANMPGLVTTVNVTAGQRVRAGEVVAVLDSMKLLYSYESPIDGEVSTVVCKVGDTVSGGQLMVEVTPIEMS